MKTPDVEERDPRTPDEIAKAIEKARQAELAATGPRGNATMSDNALAIAAVLAKMQDDYGIPYDTGMDVLRMVMMFAIDTDKAAAAVTPEEMSN